YRPSFLFYLVCTPCTPMFNLHKYDNLSILEYIPSQYEKENGHADENTIISYLCARATEYIEKMDMTIHVISRR
ncbi:MAG: hypothetical protein ACLTCJ_05645, partial [Gemmiger formicilis]|uniref:hypothetical protein n=1 Tax=Gemmiger formicilis TaxID=745368 RepID=UPI003A1D1349